MPSFSEFCNRVQLKESAILYSQTIEKNKKNGADESSKFDDQINTKHEKEPVVDVAKSCAEHKISKKFVLNDGTLVEMDPNIAEKIVYVNEELNTNNKKLFNYLLENNIQTYQMAIVFCDNYN